MNVQTITKDSSSLIRGVASQQEESKEELLPIFHEELFSRLLAPSPHSCCSSSIGQLACPFSALLGVFDFLLETMDLLAHLQNMPDACCIDPFFGTMNYI